MKALLIYILLFAINYNVLAQTKNIEKSSESNNTEFSSFSKKRNDGHITHVEYNQDSTQIVSRRHFIMGEPSGEWLVMKGNRMTVLDYDFKMIYMTEKSQFCRDSSFNDMVKNRFEDNPELGYEAPISGDGKTIFELFQEGFIIPKKFHGLGIRGKSYIQFEVDTSGLIHNILIVKKNIVDLDKEAIRVIRSMKLVEPAKLNGKPVPICLLFPLNFD